MKNAKEDGTFGLTDFTAASLSNKDLSIKNVKDTFTQLDIYNAKKLSAKSIAQFFTRRAREISQEDVEVWFEEHGLQKDETIDMDRFNEIIAINEASSDSESEEESSSGTPIFV